MSDRIELRGLRVMAHCGVLPEELERRQPVSIDLDVETDFTDAGRSDALDDTIDYGGLVATVAELADTHRYNLLERFASDVAEQVLADPRVSAVRVTVTKLRPPVPHDLASSGVTLRRARA